MWDERTLSNCQKPDNMAANGAAEDGGKPATASDVDGGEAPLAAIASASPTMASLRECDVLSPATSHSRAEVGEGGHFIMKVDERAEREQWAVCRCDGDIENVCSSAVDQFLKNELSAGNSSTCQVLEVQRYQDIDTTGSKELGRKPLLRCQKHFGQSSPVPGQFGPNCVVYRNLEAETRQGLQYPAQGHGA